MNEKRKNKISLEILIIFIIIGIFAVILMVSKFERNRKVGDIDNRNMLQNELVQEREENNNVINEEIEPIVIESMEDSFSFEFLKMENNKSNMIYSPLSIKYALSMLSEGANGETKLQIDNVVGKLNLTKYNNIDKILSLANGIYIRDSYKKYVKDSFRDNMINNFEAEVRYDSFKNAKNINSWIENKTLGILKNVLIDDIVNQSQMLLINALAIDMEWANAFNDDKTCGKAFYLENGKEIIATTMNKKFSTEELSYYSDDNITAITMDLKEYDNTQLEFMVIMPEKNLDEYIKTVTTKEMQNITDKLIKSSDTSDGVEISIPKFEFDYVLKIKEDLQKLGIEDAFDREKADFSNMAETYLYVSKAIHKADIKFSEEGIRAAAVTVLAMDTNALPMMEEETVRININKPFVFLIKDKKNGEIWFVGTVYEPNLWENDKTEYKKY